MNYYWSLGDSRCHVWPTEEIRLYLQHEQQIFVLLQGVNVGSDAYKR